MPSLTHPMMCSRHFSWEALLSLALPFALAFAVRLGSGAFAPVPRMNALLIGLAILGLSFAVGTRRQAWGIWFCAALVLSLCSFTWYFLHLQWADGQWQGPARFNWLFGATLVCASIAFAWFACRRPPLGLRTRYYGSMAAIYAFGALAVILFAVAIAQYPGGKYHLFREMLSKLGRSPLNGVYASATSLCFSFGLFSAALGTALLFPMLRCLIRGKIRQWFLVHSGLLMVAGFLIIALVPENYNDAHNFGVTMAAIGGAIAITLIAFGAHRPKRISNIARKAWFAWMVLVVGIFETFIFCSIAKILPFSPYVTTMQKMVIGTYIIWVAWTTTRLFPRRRPMTEFPPGPVL